jgi:hypothetical protein
MVDLGSLSWGYASTRFYATSPADSVGISDTGDLQAVCDSFARYETGALADMPDASFFVNSTKMSATVKRIAVKDSRYTDAGAFKTAMSGVMLCYTLATPITYTLTPVQVKTLLGENRIYADAGDVEVSYKCVFDLGDVIRTQGLTLGAGASGKVDVSKSIDLICTVAWAVGTNTYGTDLLFVSDGILNTVHLTKTGEDSGPSYTYENKMIVVKNNGSGTMKAIASKS